MRNDINFIKSTHWIWVTTISGGCGEKIIRDEFILIDDIIKYKRAFRYRKSTKVFLKDGTILYVNREFKCFLKYIDEIKRMLDADDE